MPFRNTLTDMSLGIVDNVPPDQIPDNSVADALNMVFDKKQQLRSRPGCTVHNTHHSLVASTYNDFSAWSTTNATRTTGVANAPDGTSTATTVEDTSDSSHGAIYEEYTALAATTEGDIWTYDVWVRVPTEPEATGDLLSIQFDLGAVGVSELFCVLVPDDRPDAAYPWDFVVLPSDSSGVLVESGVLDSVVDAGDDTYTWFHVYMSRLAETTDATEDFRIWFFPTVGSYTKVEGQKGTFAVVISAVGEARFWGQRLYKGKVLPSSVAYSSTDAVIADNYLTDRVTSLYQHRNSDGTSAVYATSGDQLFEYDSTNKYYDDITGALALPDDTIWQWVTFNGEAIGVNRSDTAAAKANPVVIPTPGGTPAALSGSPPKARYIAVFNDRVWVVDEDEPWKLSCCKLGDHEDWTDTAISSGAKTFEIGGGQDNYDITGLHVHQGLLIVFKRHSIYAVVPGSPNTDLRQYQVQQLTNEMGCLSGYTIKTVLNDVLFLSADGLASLSGLSRTGSYEAAFVSQNLDDFRNFDRGEAENAVSVVCPVKSQYIISFRGENATYNDRTYVLDYSKFSNEGAIGFTRCDGAWLAQSFANILDDSGGECVLMGGAPANGVALVWVKDGNGDTFTDGAQTYAQVIQTKAYAPEDIFVRKRFQTWGLYLQLLQNSFKLAVQVKTDLTDTSVKTYTINEAGQVSVGAKWDEAVWDTAVWADSDFTDIVFTNHKFTATDSFSTVGRLMQFTLTPQEGQGYVLRGLLVTGEFLDDKERGQS